jgi:hypothetical protein
MVNPGEDIARYAKAERLLCDQAGPLLTAFVREIEAKEGVVIAEIRVTLDRATTSAELLSANCTIVRVEDRKVVNGRGVDASGQSTTQAGGNVDC